MENFSNSDFTPDGESNVLKTPCFTPLNVDLPLSFDDENSSVASVKEGYESSLLSWDSEPETDTSPAINCDDIAKEPLEGAIVNLDENYLDMEQDNQIVGLENTYDNLLWEMYNKSYDELLKRLVEKDEELRVSKFTLELSEQEIMKLKVQVENSEVQVDNVFEELKRKDEEARKQKELLEKEIFKLKIQIEESKNQLDIESSKVHQLQDQLKLKSEILDSQAKLYLEKEKLHYDNASLSKINLQLTTKLKACESRNNDLENKLSQYEAEKLKQEDEIRELQDQLKLKSEMLDSHSKLSLENDKLHRDITSLTGMNLQLMSKFEACESRNNDLEIKISQYEVEKLKQEELHATQQMVLQDEISSLREELGRRKDDLETANNKVINKLIIERDEFSAKVDMLNTKICSNDDEILDLKRYIGKLEVGMEELVISNESKLDQVNKLKVKVKELKEEVTRQNGVISYMAEEKREAIKQLCFSIEHHRSRYLELCHAYRQCKYNYGGHRHCRITLF